MKPLTALVTLQVKFAVKTPILPIEIFFVFVFAISEKINFCYEATSYLGLVIYLNIWTFYRTGVYINIFFCFILNIPSIR